MILIIKVLFRLFIKIVQTLNTLGYCLKIIIFYNRFNWDDLFKILTKSSPTSLFKFKLEFQYGCPPRLESLKLFFDNWKDRHPMLLQTHQLYDSDDVYSDADDLESYWNKYSNLIEKYKAVGIVKKYDNTWF